MTFDISSTLLIFASGSSHNYLRISRILKCLSEFGLEHLNAGFLLHVLNEQSEHDELNTPTLKNSMDKWWANCIRNVEEREWIGRMVRRVRTEEFSFTREMYESALERRRETGSFEEREENSLDEYSEEENGEEEEKEEKNEEVNGSKA